MKFDETADLFLFPRKDFILFFPPSPLPSIACGVRQHSYKCGCDTFSKLLLQHFTSRRSNSARPCLDIQVASWRNPFQGAPCWDVDAPCCCWKTPGKPGVLPWACYLSSDPNHLGDSMGGQGQACCLPADSVNCPANRTQGIKRPEHFWLYFSIPLEVLCQVL